MPSVSLIVNVLVLCILSAQAQAEDTSGAAEPECDCQLAYLAGAANRVRMTVHMHPSILQQDTTDDIAGHDPFTAGDNDDNLKIPCACNLTYTADLNPLAFLSTEAMQEELLRRAYANSQKSAESAYECVMALLNLINYLVVVVLRQLLEMLIGLAATHRVTLDVMKCRKQAREFSKLF
jgi:hypothetical protein